MNGVSKNNKKSVSILQTGSAAWRTIERQVKENPYAAIAVASGAAFGLGALMSSHVGRMITFLCVSYVAKELARGEVGKRVGDVIRKEIDDVTADSRMRS